jgi:hypothetical protein
VDHLGDFGQTPVARTQVTVRGDRPGDQQDNAWPQSLATGGKQVPWEYGSLTGDALILSAIKQVESKK